MKKTFWALAVCLICFLTIHSQTTNTGDIYGKALLADGSPLPGVTVTLSGQTIAKLHMVTSVEGNYRFLRLSPGRYDLTFELEGFKTMVRKNIQVQVAGAATVNVIMETGVLTETVEVVGKMAMIDTRRTTVGTNISSEVMQSLPTGNSVVAIVNLTPGVYNLTPNVGGMGGNTRFTGSGTIPHQNQFFIDGASADNTDYYARTLGASINTQYLEETQVSVGAHDITNRQGGVQVNFITKRGGNKISGNAFINLMDKKFEMNQTLPANMITSKYVPQGIERSWEYGANLGFPILKDHLWFFGSAVMGDTMSRSYTNVVSRADGGSPNYYGKINAQYRNTKAEFTYNWSNSKSIGRFYSEHANTTRDSSSTTEVFVARADHSIGNLLISGKYSYVKGFSGGNGHGYTLTGTGKTYAEGATFAYPGMACARNFDYADDYYATPNATQSYAYATGTRPYGIVDVNYYRENILGGDHEFKVGVEADRAEYKRVNMPMGQFLNVFNYKDSNYPGGKVDYISILRDGVHDLITDRTGFFFQDTVTYKKLTVIFGLRYDIHQWKWKELIVHEHNAINLDGSSWLRTNAPAWIPYLGEIILPAGTASLKPKAWSPRLSFTYDLTGNGRNVLKLSFARYGGALDNAELNGTQLALGSGYPVFTTPFVDANNNYWPDKGEFTAYTPNEINQILKEKKLPGWNYYGYSGVNQDGPLPRKVPSTIIGPDFKPRTVDEVILGFEKQLGDDFVIQANAQYKRNFNEQYNRAYFGKKDNPRLVTKGDFILAGTDPVTGRPAYQLNPALGSASGNFFTNYKDSYRSFYGLQFQFHKKLSHHWMLNVSADFNDFTFHWADDEYYGSGQDLIDYFDGAPELSSYTTFANWQFKINGIWQLPAGFTLSGILTSQQGLPVAVYVNRYLGVSFPAKGTKFGDSRLGNVSILNLALERTFPLDENKEVVLSVRGYNILNDTTVTAVNMNSIPQLFLATEVVRPGIIQFGVRVNF